MKSSAGVTDPHLKDVYAAWLKDLYEDDPAKVVKRLQRRAAASKHDASSSSSSHRTTKSTLRALQRPTEASASKHVSQRQVRSDHVVRHSDARV